VETQPSQARTSIPQQIAAEDSPVVALQGIVRRHQAAARNPREDLVWQPRFAYTSAAVIFVALTLISLPIWVVLIRITSASTNNGAGPKVSDLVALSMMLLGGFFTAAAAWTIIIEMRGRVRMVDTLARTSENQVIAAPALPILDEPVFSDAPSAAPANQPLLPFDLEDDDEDEDETVTISSAPSPIAVVTVAPPAAPVSAPVYAPPAEGTSQQQSVPATLEASSHLLSSFSNVLRAFGQLPAQVAMLAVALALFVGATVLSLH
jgi:hypothetical protein